MWRTLPRAPCRSVDMDCSMICRSVGRYIHLYFYPVPGRGTGYCFRSISLFISLFVSLSATLRENGWTDLHEIFREGVEWPWDDLIKFWVNSGKRVSGSKVNLFVIWFDCGLLAVLCCHLATENVMHGSMGSGFVVPHTTACFHLYSPQMTRNYCFQFLPHDARRAKCSIAIICLSLSPLVRPSVCM